jgi:polysaccharide export outer membrane protein
MVFLAVAFMAAPLWGGDVKPAKWGLWSDPQPDILNQGGSSSPQTPAPSEVKQEAARAVTLPASELYAGDRGVTDSDYRIGPGDQLDILVWKDETLTRTVTVLPEGKISFPLIGDIVAAGKTVGELKKEFETKLAKYVSEPVVSVDVKQVNSALIYVIGRVNNPGRFVLNADISVMQALAMAGGCNPFARRNKIKIMRTEGDTTRVIQFRYDDLVDDGRIDQNIRLKRGDVVVVP